MVILVNGVVVLLVALCAILIGLINYKTTEKKNYNPLKFFPFELQNNPVFKYNTAFRLVLTFFSSSILLLAFNVFVFPIMIDQAYIEAILLALVAVFLLITFIVDFRQFRFHFIASSIFMVSLLSSYLYLGYIVLIDNYHVFDRSLAIISFVMAGILLILLLIPLFSEWWKLDRNDEQNKEQYSRKKINTYAISEWLYFLSVIILTIIITIYSYL